MTNTEKFFVKCVGVGIKGATISELPNDLDYQHLYKLCATHSVSVIILNALKDVRGSLNDKFLILLERLAERHVIMDVQSAYDISTVIRALESNRIKHMPLKGYYLKHLYPSTDMRYASDCDILIDPAQIDNVRELMDRLGLKVKRYDEHHDIFYFPSTKTVFEMHKVLFVGTLEKYFGVGFERAKVKEGTEYFYQMSNEDFYISVLAHSAYHFAESAGVGIRHLTDIYLYKENHSLDETYLCRELDKCGLLSFRRKMEALADYFFEDVVVDEFILKLADHVIESSVLANEAKSAASVVAASSKTGDGKNGKIRALIGIIFPKMENMKHSYPILKRMVWLLPFFYPVRWIHVLLKRPERIVRIKTVADARPEEVKLMKSIRSGLEIEHI